MITSTSFLLRGRAVQRSLQTTLARSVSSVASVGGSLPVGISTGRSTATTSSLRHPLKPPVQQKFMSYAVARDDYGTATDPRTLKQQRKNDVLISEVLKSKYEDHWVDPVIFKDSTVREAIETVIDGGLSGMMVVEKDPNDHSRRVVGLVTSRDVLRILAHGLKKGISEVDLLNQVVSEHMTPISQVIYGRPHETIGQCRKLIAKLGIKCLPILSDEGRVEGVITARDMSDFGLSALDKGGKKAYLNDISERVGLTSSTSMAEPPTHMKSKLAMENMPLSVCVGIAELPHPFKTADGVGGDRREHGPREFSTDADLSEDAFFTRTMVVPTEQGGVVGDLLYFGVADGVGSWREYKVDPREFSHTLMGACDDILQENMRESRIQAPSDILTEAYERVKAKDIIGSCTACIAMFDTIRHQLHFSNLGDSGIIVLRHMDSDVAGSLAQESVYSGGEQPSDLRVAFVSQQQLHSFNHPYQLGWVGYEQQEKNSFKAVSDAGVTSVHIRHGDIIIMGTDGLFDNVEVEDIAKVCLDWEQNNGSTSGSDISADDVTGLASKLCEVAREKSLDRSIDSPFAILAKDNDIMWSGGMPDDCTVVIAHVKKD
eukprot:Nitzschia sp. Nitz4//scaffold13_size275219//264513//266508//NITZ4_000930-RA/size275219-augustus-gene-0.245-mRNA-1//1//CDS//3329536182//7336//frame0